ncbi:hypothetical protein ACFX16_046903 [Malus domestica]
MLRHFRLGTKKKWRSIGTSTPCATYEEFYEVLVRIEDSENMPSESEDEEEKNRNQRRDDKGEAAVDAILVNIWGIGLHIALRISRGPNNLPYHRLHRSSKLQDLVVMPKLVVEVHIIIKATPLLILQGNISTRRTLIIRVVTLSIREVLCHISQIQQVDPSGTGRDSPSK